MEQRSTEWFAARCGSLGASQLNEALATTKNGWGASRENLKNRIIGERLTGIVEPSFVSKPMLRGIEMEDTARKAYEAHTGTFVEEMGIAPHPTLKHTHASPDGLVGDDGLIEIKVPNVTTHIKTLRSKKAPSEYIKQMMWQMRCTGRKWCDFVSWDDRAPKGMELFIVRVERDEELIEKLDAQVAEFLEEIDQEIEHLHREYSHDAE